MNEKLYIDDKQASVRYSYSRQWFQRMRWSGGGPPFLKIKGRVLYPLATMDKWFSDHQLQTSTSAQENKKEETHD